MAKLGSLVDDAIKRFKGRCGGGLWPWPFADMEGTQEWFEICTPPQVAGVLIYLDQCLRGVSEVVFMNNPLSGLVIMIALIIFDTRVGLHGLLGVLVSTGTAKVLRTNGYKGYDGVDIGLFGFNGVLLGLGIATFTDDKLESNVAQAIIVLVFCVLNCIVQSAVASWLTPMPCFTLPFNICVMWFLGGAHSYKRFSSALEPGIMDVMTSQMASQDYCIRELSSDSCDSAWDYVAGFLVATLQGVCQIYLAQSVLSGALILAAMSLCSPVCALLTALGSAAGCATALLVGGSPIGVHAGLWGFNPALTCCAIGGGIFGIRGPLQWCAGVFGAVVTVFFQFSMAGLLAPGGLVTFTAPFCFVTLFILAADLVPPFPCGLDADVMASPSAQASSLIVAGGGGSARRTSICSSPANSPKYPGSRCFSRESISPDKAMANTMNV